MNTVRVKCPICPALGQFCRVCNGVGFFDAEPAEAELLPAALRVRVGNLEITGPKTALSRAAFAGRECTLTLDGRPFPFTRFRLEVDCKHVVCATVEFLPKSGPAPARENADTPLTVKAGGE